MSNTASVPDRRRSHTERRRPCGARNSECPELVVDTQERVGLGAVDSGTIGAAGAF